MAADRRQQLRALRFEPGPKLLPELAQAQARALRVRAQARAWVLTQARLLLVQPALQPAWRFAPTLRQRQRLAQPGH